MQPVCLFKKQNYLFCDNLVWGEVPKTPSVSCSVVLSEKIGAVKEDLFPLYRAIMELYRDLPWPSSIKQVAVVTNMAGGFGDLAAGAKAVGVFRRLCPDTRLDWIIRGDVDNPESFLFCNREQVHVRKWDSLPLDYTDIDLLLTGPVADSWPRDYLEKGVGRKIVGPMIRFVENGTGMGTLPREEEFVREKIGKGIRENRSDSEIYSQADLHQWLFPSDFKVNYRSSVCISMGLYPGSGVLFDLDREESIMPEKISSISLLEKIKDPSLKKDLLDTTYDPDKAFSQTSLNFGYAHFPFSWGTFIDFVAMNEKEKAKVVVVLNQNGCQYKFPTDEFCEKVFTPERLDRLKQIGFTGIVLKGQDKTISLPEASGSRPLIVIIRARFSPIDMHYLQRASERLLATGDNSALESWSAGCKLYLYEDLSKYGNGSKRRFLEQQMEVAEQFSPSLRRLLEIFGYLPDADEMAKGSLSQNRMEEAAQLLEDPDLPEATFRMCRHIVSQYSFAKVLEVALMRSAWHSSLPQLAQIEEEMLPDDFKSSVVQYLDSAPRLKKIAISNLNEMGEKIGQKTSQIVYF